MKRDHLVILLVAVAVAIVVAMFVWDWGAPTTAIPKAPATTTTP